MYDYQLLFEIFQVFDAKMPRFCENEGVDGAILDLVAYASRKDEHVLFAKRP